MEKFHIGDWVINPDQKVLGKILSLNFDGDVEWMEADGSVHIGCQSVNDRLATTKEIREAFEGVWQDISEDDIFLTSYDVEKDIFKVNEVTVYKNGQYNIILNV